MENKEQKYNSQIEEYKSLRQEIMSRQNARLLILGFTVTVIGTILGLTLREEISFRQNFNHYAFALIAFAIAVIITALVLTIHHTQQIDVISGYIRRFIEPNVEGLCWETRWTRYRESMRSKRSSALPLGTSKPLAVFYGVLTIGTFLLSLVIGLRWFPDRALLFGLMLLSLSGSADLYLRRTKGWKIDWKVVDDKSHENEGDPL